MNISNLISICCQHGIRVYPVPWRGQYAIEIEFNKDSNFERRNQRKIIRSEQLFSIKGNEWIENLQLKYKEIYEQRIAPKIEKTGHCKASYIQPLYSKP